MKNATPDFGINYAIGWVGFTYHDNSFISTGIAWFERWIERDRVHVTHTFIVTGQDECIEAAFDGVVRSTLSKYFDDPSCHVYFKKPRRWNIDVGLRTKITAYYYVGRKYNYWLIVGMALSHTFIGRLIDILTHGKSTKWLEKIFNEKNTEICSQVVADILKDQTEYKLQGCLQLPSREIMPETLEQDNVIFEPLTYRV